MIYYYFFFSIWLIHTSDTMTINSKKVQQNHTILKERKNKKVYFFSCNISKGLTKKSCKMIITRKQQTLQSKIQL